MAEKSSDLPSDELRGFLTGLFSCASLCQPLNVPSAMSGEYLGSVIYEISL
jgi:hypothetical protein